MRWPFYRLMERPPAEGGDPGSTNVPPADPPPTDPPTDPPEPRTISVEALPEELRDRPDAEIQFLLNGMVSGLATRNQDVQTLQQQLATLQGQINAPPPAEPDPDDDKPLSELMLEDPDKAMSRWMKEKGYVKAFDSLTERVGGAEYTMVAGEIDDFETYREDVDLLLQEGNLAPTRSLISSLPANHTLVPSPASLRYLDLYEGKSSESVLQPSES